MYNITNYRSKIPFNRNSKLSTARSSAKHIKHFGETWTRDSRPCTKDPKIDEPNGPGTYDDIKSWIKSSFFGQKSSKFAHFEVY